MSLQKDSVALGRRLSATSFGQRLLNSWIIDVTRSEQLSSPLWSERARGRERGGEREGGRKREREREEPRGVHVQPKL